MISATELQGRIGLGSRMSSAVGRMVVDGVAESIGRALPRTPEHFADPDVVNELLQADVPAGQSALPLVRSVWLPGVEFESSNCTNFLVELEFDDSVAEYVDLPRTAYVKMPCPELATRAFANAVGFWEVEIAFCQRVASRVPIRVPRVYAAARRGARSTT